MLFFCSFFFAVVIAGAIEEVGWEVENGEFRLGLGAGLCLFTTSRFGQGDFFVFASF